MIIRIFSDGQYRIPQDAQARLHELDVETVHAIDANDEAAFATSYGALEEAREEFTGEGLIPD